MRRQTMMLWLAVTGLLISGCTSTPCTVSMDSPPVVRETPMECRTRCPSPPAMSLPPGVWELEVLAWGFNCARLHSDCVEAMEP